MKHASCLMAGALLAAGFAAQAKEGGDQYPNGVENWPLAPCRRPVTIS